MEAVLHRDAEQVAAAKREGGDQQRGALEVRDHVGAAVLGRQKRAGLLGGQAGRREGQKQLPGGLLAAGGGHHPVSTGVGNYCRNR